MKARQEQFTYAPILGSLVGPVQYAETHGHSNLFNDGLLSPQQIFDQAKRRGLNWVYITDHDSTRGSEELIRLTANDPDINTDLSQEISTTKGHLLAWGHQNRVPHSIPPEAAIDWVHDEGGVVGAAHINFAKTHSITWDTFFDLRKRGYAIDAVELRNGGVAKTVDLNQKLQNIPLVNKWADRIFGESDSNDEAIEIFNAHELGGKVAAIAGTDYHYRRGVGLEVAIIPEGMTFIDAVREAETAVGTSGFVEPVTVFDEVIHRIYGKRLRRDRNEERNGIIAYREPLVLGVQLQKVA